MNTGALRRLRPTWRLNGKAGLNSFTAVLSHELMRQRRSTLQRSALLWPSGLRLQIRRFVQ